MLAWRIFGVLRVSVFLSLARSKMAIVRLPRALPKNYLFCIYFRWGEGNPTSVWGPPPIIWLHFLLPLPMSGDPRSLKCEHLCDPHSFLTVTFWLLDNFSSTGGGGGGRVSFPPPRLREPSRDIIIKFQIVLKIALFSKSIFLSVLC